MKKTNEQPSQSDIILYTSPDGKVKINVFFGDETVWLSQTHIAELFQKTTSTINEHIKNVYEEHELDQNSTIRKFRIVQPEGNWMSF